MIQGTKKLITAASAPKKAKSSQTDGSLENTQIIGQTCAQFKVISNSAIFKEFDENLKCIEDELAKSKGALMSADLKACDAAFFLISYFRIHAYLHLCKKSEKTVSQQWVKIEPILKNAQPLVHHCLTKLNNCHEVPAITEDDNQNKELSLVKYILRINYYLFDYAKFEDINDLLKSNLNFALELNKGLIESADKRLKQLQIMPTTKVGHESFVRDRLSEETQHGFLPTPMFCHKTGFELDCVSPKYDNFIVEVDGEIFHKNTYGPEYKIDNIYTVFKKLILRNAGYSIGVIESQQNDFEASIYSKGSQVIRLLNLPVILEAIEYRKNLSTLKAEARSLFATHHKQWSEQQKKECLNIEKQTDIFINKRDLEHLIKQSYKQYRSKTQDTARGTFTADFERYQALYVAISDFRQSKNLNDPRHSKNIAQMENCLKQIESTIKQTLLPLKFYQEAVERLEKLKKSSENMASLDNIVSAIDEPPHQPSLEVDIILQRSLFVSNAQRVLLSLVNEKNLVPNAENQSALSHVKTFLDDYYVTCFNHEKMTETQKESYNKLLNLSQESVRLKAEMSQRILNKTKVTSQVLSFQDDLESLHTQREEAKLKVNKIDAVIKNLEMTISLADDSLKDVSSNLKDCLEKSMLQRETSYYALQEIDKPFQCLKGLIQKKQEALSSHKIEFKQLSQAHDEVQCKIKEMTQPPCVINALKQLSPRIPETVSTPKDSLPVLSEPRDFLPMFCNTSRLEKSAPEDFESNSKPDNTTKENQANP